MCQPSQYDEIKKAFNQIDKDLSGIIEVSELKKVLLDCNFGEVVSDAAIDDIIKQIDNDSNGKINYTEFIAATLDIRKYLTNERVEALFKSFDVDDNDVIEPANIKDAFTKLGKDVTDEDIKTIMMMHDENGDGKISLEEFKNMLLGCHLSNDEKDASMVLMKE